jgi:hypothetical protein
LTLDECASDELVFGTTAGVASVLNARQASPSVLNISTSVISGLVRTYFHRAAKMIKRAVAGTRNVGLINQDNQDILGFFRERDVRGARSLT